MIRNYFKIALRNIKRYSAHSILNISGMAIGMASALLILLWVYDEWSYDRHFIHADDLYRVIEIENPSEGSGSMMVPTPGALANALKEENPEIIRSSRYIPEIPLTLKKGDEFIEETVAMVDKDFLKMFNIEFMEGDINSALNDPHNIILTEETAHKYFGDEDAFGKTIPSRGYDAKVTGIIKCLPRNSHLLFNFLVPVEWLTIFGGPINNWRDRFHIYIELKKGTDSKIVDQKISGILKSHIRESHSEIFLQNIKKIHLFSSGKYTYDVSGHGDITYVRIMTLIAVFILIIACINFMNLSTAQSAKRAKEIGVRKVAGANKRKLIFQFLGESLLIVFVAHIIAMIFVELLLPGFNNLTGKPLAVNYQNAGLYIGLISVVLFCGLLAGSYPALYLSSLKPLNIMKGIINKNPGNAQFRRMLVIFQFSFSVVLIICALIIGIQLRYLQNKSLGFNKNNIGYFMFPTRPGDSRLESLKKVISDNPYIVGVTKGGNPVNIEGTVGGFNWSGKKKSNDIMFYVLSGDADYAKTFQLELKQGRFFSSEFPADSFAVVINEKAASVMGFENPIGEILSTPWGSKLKIIGIVKDFHFKSLHYKIEPLIMLISASNNFYIRMKPDHIPSTVESVERLYKSFDPGLPINFHFLDDDFDKLYRTEQRMSKIFGYFSFLAIIISCLGLIGLSSFMTERRTKEIGIRKANGAKSGEIFLLLSKEYMLWVMASIIIACPIAFYTMHKWLQNFAYRINISWWVFAMAGAIALVVALITVGFQSYKAAGKNPVDALRYE
jgi:putative ABC transport system permease protein